LSAAALHGRMSIALLLIWPNLILPQCKLILSYILLILSLAKRLFARFLHTFICLLPLLLPLPVMSLFVPNATCEQRPILDCNWASSAKEARGKLRRPANANYYCVFISSRGLVYLDILLFPIVFQVHTFGQSRHDPFTIYDIKQNCALTVFLLTRQLQLSLVLFCPL
jgi:hypothetical protein